MFLFLLPHSLCYSLALSLAVVSISHLQAAISGHSVTMAILGHRAAGAHSGTSLFLCSPSPAVCLFSRNMELLSCFALSVLCPGEDDSTLFPHTSLLAVALCTLPSLALLSPLCVALSVSLFVVRRSAAGWLESCQSRLSCGVSSCQAYQSCAPAYMTF